MKKVFFRDIMICTIKGKENTFVKINEIEQLRTIIKQFENNINRSAMDLNNKVIFRTVLPDLLGYSIDKQMSITESIYLNKECLSYMFDISKKDKLIVEVYDYDDVGMYLPQNIQRINNLLDEQKCIWALVTNGCTFCLINRIQYANYDINSSIVLRVDIGTKFHKRKNEKYFMYFSKEKIFDTKVTTFYRDIAIFFNLHKRLSDSSRDKYCNTLYNFFDFYASQKGEYRTFSSAPYRALEEIEERDVMKFFQWNNPNGRPNSGRVQKEKCAHIYMMFQILYDHHYISKNKMEKLLEHSIEAAGNQEDLTINRKITQKDMREVYQAVKSLNKPHKTIIFILVSYYGFDRKLIVDFLSMSWKKIKFNENMFVLRNRSYPLVKSLQNELQKLKKCYEENNNIPARLIYGTKKSGGYYSVKEDVVNVLFSEDLDTFKKEHPRWKTITAQEMRGCVIYNMHEKGYSIDEIAYLSNASITQILRYIKNETALNNGESLWQKESGEESRRKMHPFQAIFD